jgi:hypothetical protein
MPDDPTTKGTIFRSLVKFVESDLSDAQRAAAFAALPESDRQLLERGRVLATDKVSEFTLNRITVAAAKARGENLEAFGRRAGRAELADAVGVYRFFTILLTPKALLHKASALWTTVHSHGQLLVENETDTSAVVRLKGFPSEEAHCARLSGWFEGAGAMTGVKNITVRHAVCVTRGGAECQWQLSWQK